MRVSSCISDYSNISVCVTTNKEAEEKEDAETRRFRKECREAQAAKKEICGLMRRLECAENQILNAAKILQHLSTMENIIEKISSMSPFPHYSEGNDIRRHMWEMERRISKLKRKYTTTLLERQRRISSNSDTDEDRMDGNIWHASIGDEQEYFSSKLDSVSRKSGSESNELQLFPNKSSQFLKKKESSSSEDAASSKILSSIASSVRFELPQQTVELSKSEPYQTKIQRKLSQISLRISPTMRILGGDVTVREHLRKFNEHIHVARDKFINARKTMFQLSKLLFHVKDVVDLDSLCNCSKEMDRMKSALNSLTGGQYESGGMVDFVHNKRLRKSEELLKDFDSRMPEIRSVNNRIDRFNRNVKELESNLSILFGRLDAGLPLRSGINDNPTKINHLFHAITILEQNVKDLSKVPPKLKESEIQRDAAVDAIEEYVELLEIIKLDKIDLEKAISEKSSVDQLKKKVPLLEVETKKREFNLLIDQNTSLFKNRDEDRKSVAKCVQDLLSTKIGLKELLSFEKFLNKKLEELVNEIEMTPEVQHQIETAGTRKMLRNEPLNDAPLCFECAAERRAAQPPSSRRVALTPYHAYELRALREKQRRLSNNMKLPQNYFPLHWQKVLEKQGPHQNNKTKHRDRRTGGQHTKTTPQQRLFRPIPCEEMPICHHEEIPDKERGQIQENTNQ